MEAIKKAMLCSRYAEEKKAKDILILELKGLTDIADYFLIASGTSERHVRTIAEYIEESMKEAGIKHLYIEGYKDGRWVIIDYNDFVAHIFLEELRELYDLESLWIEAKQIKIEEQKS